MVREFFIDCEKLCERAAAHRYLVKTFGLPEYYGNNLDALFDCMTEMDECTVYFKGAVELYEKGGYGARILEVMRDAAAANPLLRMAMAEDEAVDK